MRESLRGLADEAGQIYAKSTDRKEAIKNFRRIIEQAYNIGLHDGRNTETPVVRPSGEKPNDPISDQEIAQGLVPGAKFAQGRPAENDPKRPANVAKAKAQAAKAGPRGSSKPKPAAETTPEQEPPVPEILKNADPVAPPADTTPVVDEVVNSQEDAEAALGKF